MLSHFDEAISKVGAKSMKNEKKKLTIQERIDAIRPPPVIPISISANKFINQPVTLKKHELNSCDTPTFSRRTSKRSFSGLKMKPQIYGKKPFLTPTPQPKVAKKTSTGTSIPLMARQNSSETSKNSKDKIMVEIHNMNDKPLISPPDEGTLEPVVPTVYRAADFLPMISKKTYGS